MMPRDFLKGEGDEEGRETRATSAPRDKKGQCLRDPSLHR